MVCFFVVKIPIPLHAVPKVSWARMHTLNDRARHVCILWIALATCSALVVIASQIHISLNAPRLATSNTLCVNITQSLNRVIKYRFAWNRYAQCVCSAHGPLIWAMGRNKNEAREAGKPDCDVTHRNEINKIGIRLWQMRSACTDSAPTLVTILVVIL